MSRRLKDEGGFVLVPAIVILTIALLIAGVAVSDTVLSRQKAGGDVRVRRAQQAADTGLQTMLYRLNLVAHNQVNYNGGLGPLSVGLACALQKSGLGFHLGANVAGITATAGTVCAGGGTVAPPDPSAAIWERGGDHTRSTAYFVAGPRNTGAGLMALDPEIVAVGVDDNGTASVTDDVVARARAILRPVDPFRAIEARRDVRFRGVSTTINGNVRAGRDFRIEPSLLLATFVGGNILTGGSLINTARFSYGRDYVSTGLSVPVPMPQPDAQGWTRDPISISPTKPSCGGAAPSGPCPPGYAGDNRLNVTSGTVTLSAGDYVFCSVSVSSGATLRTDTTGGPVRVYVDSPGSARCSNAAHNGSLAIDGRLNPGVSLAPEAVQFYLVGNGTNGGTFARFGTSSTALASAFFLYAPTSNVTVSYTTFQGSVIGYDVDMIATQVGLSVIGVITQDLNLMNMPLAAGVGLFRVRQYVTCRGSYVTFPAVTANC